jgi:ABC-type dipeptide/oligopeptide/nickel transport system permease subunit
MAMATVSADAPVVPTWGGGRGRARAGQAAGWALTALTAVVVIILLAAPGLIAHVSPVAGSTDILKSPGAAHWFGTDQLGRDVFSRTVYGARPVLIASLLGVLVAIVAGVAIGLAAGTAPRWLNAVIMRIIDVCCWPSRY